MIPKEPKVTRFPAVSVAVDIHGMHVPMIANIAKDINAIGLRTTDKGRARAIGNVATRLNRRLPTLRQAQASVIPHGMIPESHEYYIVEDEKNALSFRETIVVRTSLKNHSIDYRTFIFNVTLN